MWRGWNILGGVIDCPIKSLERPSLSPISPDRKEGYLRGAGARIIPYSKSVSSHTISLHCPISIEAYLLLPSLQMK